MRTYTVWADGNKAKDNLSSLALALHSAYEAASHSEDGYATVWQGSEFTATVDMVYEAPGEQA